MPDPQQQPHTPAQPVGAHGQQQQETGGAGGFFGGLFQDFAENLGFEIKEIHLAHQPWLEHAQIGWRVGNTGNKAFSGFQCFIQVVDTNVGDQHVMVRKDYTDPTTVPPDGQADCHFTLEDFNHLARDNWSMNGQAASYRLNARSKYRFDVWIDTANGWDKGGSVEFGVEFENQLDHLRTAVKQAIDHLSGEDLTHWISEWHVENPGEDDQHKKDALKHKADQLDEEHLHAFEQRHPPQHAEFQEAKGFRYAS
ncbi:MAG: hypothetical protein ACRD29_07000 [Acidimicrobiales bacterium]